MSIYDYYDIRDAGMDVMAEWKEEELYEDWCYNETLKHYEDIKIIDEFYKEGSQNDEKMVNINQPHNTFCEYISEQYEKWCNDFYNCCLCMLCF